jgi:putative CocE/NonD family hydrolase
MVGGTYDAEDPFGVWKVYRSLKENNPKLDCRIVVGPWAHGAWRSNDDANRLGEVEFSPESMSEFYRKEVEFPFFEQKLRGVGDGGASTSGALIFFSGENCWREMEEWNAEKQTPTKFYLQEDGSLRKDAPIVADSYSLYTSDPKNPVPYYHDTSTTRKNEYVTASQEFVDGREDVLTFLSPVLEEDVMVAGAVDAELFVALSQRDADFVVKVIDVGPDGEYESLVRANIMRGRYRNSMSNPEPFEVGEVEKVAFELPDIAHTFMAGHRIKVQVQSSWFPLFDRNPQQYINIYEAKDEDYLPCDVKIYHSAEYPSSVTLRIME